MGFSKAFKSYHAGSVNVFAVLNTDAKAGKALNAEAYRHILELQTRYGSAPAEGRNNTDLTSIGTLKGIVDVGITKAENAGIANDYKQGLTNHQRKSEAFDAAVNMIGRVGPMGDAVSLGGESLKDSIIWGYSTSWRP